MAFPESLQISTVRCFLVRPERISSIDLNIPDSNAIDCLTARRITSKRNNLFGIITTCCVRFHVLQSHHRRALGSLDHQREVWKTISLHLIWGTFTCYFSRSTLDLEPLHFSKLEHDDHQCDPAVVLG